jgi:hypothetical protein
MELLSDPAMMALAVKEEQGVLVGLRVVKQLR